MNADQIADNRRVSMGNVAKRSRMHDYRRILDCLQQVWLNRVCHDYGHRASSAKLLGGNWFALCVVADDNSRESCAHIFFRFC